MNVLPVSTYEIALRKLYEIVLKYGELPTNFVINGDSLYGPDIWKSIINDVARTATQDDSFVIFEFKEIQNDSFAITEMNDAIHSLVPYMFYIRVYGNQCHTLAQKLQAAFHLPSVVVKLRDAGLKINSTSQVNSLNEFINGSRIQRCDFDVGLLCNFEFNFDLGPIAESVGNLDVKDI